MAHTARPRVAFRVEASLHIGTGHLMRCLGLAEDLTRRGARCIFVARAWGPQEALVRAHGHGVEVLPPFRGRMADGVRSDDAPYAAWLGGSWREDAEQTRATLGPLDIDWLVVDHYALAAPWERAVRPATRHLLVIDDLADRPHDCDLLLDFNAHADAVLRYRPRTNNAARCLFGPAFALLRGEFAEARRNQPPFAARQSLFIGFGGADADNLTLRCVQAAAGICAAGTPCDVVVGATYPHLGPLRDALATPGHAATRLHVATDQVAQLMARARMAVCGGGVSTWERLCLGLPSLVLAAAENQVQALNHLQQQGWIRLLGRAADVSDAVLQVQVEDFWRQSAQLQALGERGAGVVDGLGAGRVVDEMLAHCAHSSGGMATGAMREPAVFLAPLGASHLARLAAWKNDRNLAHQIAAHPALFSDAAVHAWMDHHAADPNQVFLGIFERGDGQVIGVARLMFIDWISGVAELGIFIGDVGARGRGQGRAALQLLLERAFIQLGLNRVFLKVMADNIGAIRCYEACGFVPEGRLRAHFLSEGAHHDMLVMGILRAEAVVPAERS